MKENASKRQHWTSETTHRIEHLGLSVIPGDPTAEILPRGGWEPLYTTIERIGSLPGSANVRENLVAGYARPLWPWASPLTSPPPIEAAKKIFHAVLRSKCKWWCQGRWWAQRVQLHPLYSCFITAIKRISDDDLVWSLFIDNNLCKIVEQCGFIYEGFDKSHGARIGLTDHEDHRIKKITAKLRAGRNWFWTGTPEAEHAIRACCRLRLLGTCAPSRHDSEGVDRIDIEASSTKQWTNFTKGLTEDERRALSIWHSGATHTQTRRWHNGHTPVEEILCTLCKQPCPSARHLWASCPGTQQYRTELGALYHVNQNWWLAQPKVTSKTGWITLDAANNVERRGALQACACAMGIKIVMNVTKRLLDG